LSFEIICFVRGCKRLAKPFAAPLKIAVAPGQEREPGSAFSDACRQAISFSPGFNRVTSDAVHSQPFQWFTRRETVETVKEN
jgi:hypothetical protein